MLQKQQESLWGLVPVLQKSQATCSQAHNAHWSTSHLMPTYQSLSFPAIFISPVNPRRNWSSMVPRRLNPRWYLQACRNLESLAVMGPQCKLAEVPQQRGRHVQLQRLQASGRQGSNNIEKTELGLPGISRRRSQQSFS